ncbi:hypothetical protein BDD12DRAFT_807504 [Trichophaea hybrida]|nr:hypothetical protein BDD12DRAFT_807504 [Trichophaea hybrida]
MYPPINVSNSEPTPPNTNAAPPTSPSSSTATTVPPPPRPSAPTAVPPPSHPTSPKQRLTQSSFPFPAPTVQNPGTRATVVKRAKPLYQDHPRICMLLGISNDYHAVMNDYRDRIGNGIQRGEPLNVPNTSRMDTENYELASLDNVRNAATKAKRRMANGKRASFRQPRRLSCSFGQQKAENQQCESHPSADPYSCERYTDRRRRCRYPNHACCRTAVGFDSSSEQLFPVPPAVSPSTVVATLPVGTPLPVIATPPVTSPLPVATTPLVVATPPVVSLPPMVATPLVVATPAI